MAMIQGEKREGGRNISSSQTYQVWSWIIQKRQELEIWELFFVWNINVL